MQGLVTALDTNAFHLTTVAYSPEHETMQSKAQPNGQGTTNL